MHVSALFLNGHIFSTFPVYWKYYTPPGLSHTCCLLVPTAVESKLREVLLQSHMAGRNGAILWYLNPDLLQEAAGLLSSEVLYGAVSMPKGKKNKSKILEKNVQVQDKASDIPWLTCTTPKQPLSARQTTWWGFCQPARKAFTSSVCHSKSSLPSASLPT